MPAPDLRRLHDLTDRVAIITGGSRGLGLEMARGFAAAGAKVVIASRKLGVCEEAAQAIIDEGGEAIAIACHSGEVEQVQALVARTVDHFGRLDILVNNAANPLAYNIETATEAGFDKSFDVNLKGPLFLTQAAWPHLKASPSATDPQKGGASIINVTTVGAHSGVTIQIGYGSSKAALTHLTRSTAKLGAPHRIRANAIAPGPFATYMMTTGGEALMNKAAEMTAQKRCAPASEIIGPALLLASDAGAFITGTVLHVDGGQTA